MRCFLSLSFFFLSLFSFSQKDSGYIVDYSGSLNTEFIHKTNRDLANYQDSSGKQINIRIFKTLKGEDIADKAYELANKLKLGQRGNDNGLLLLVSIDDRQMRLEVGSGLEGAIPDIASKKVLDEFIRPHFKKGNYEKGIAAAYKELIRLASYEKFKAPQPNEMSFGLQIFVGALAALFALFLGGAISKYLFQWNKIVWVLLLAGLAYLLFHKEPGLIGSLIFTFTLLGTFLKSKIIPSKQAENKEKKQEHTPKSSAASTMKKADKPDENRGRVSKGEGGKFSGGGATSDW